MYVEKYMTRDPITIQEDDSIMEALQTLRRRKIRKLPVMKKGKLVGIITSKDMKEGNPSEATSLDMHELNYLLSNRKVGEIMTPNPVTIGPRELVEKAALIMHDRRFESLPVLDGGKLVGIITESDLFRYLIDISGIKEGGRLFDLELADVSGSIQDVTDIMRTHGAKIRSILVSYEDVKEGSRQVMIRVVDGNLDALTAEVRKKYPGVSIAD
jgi:acetoin utilization protein AcuB